MEDPSLTERAVEHDLERRRHARIQRTRRFPRLRQRRDAQVRDREAAQADSSRVFHEVVKIARRQLHISEIEIRLFEGAIVQDR